MGNLDQAVWNTAHGGGFTLPTKDGQPPQPARRADPAPNSWLYTGLARAATLLVLQAGVVALGACPLYALARAAAAHDWVALLFALAFLLNPSIQAANWLEFHPVTLAPTFLLAAFYCLVAKRRTGGMRSLPCWPPVVKRRSRCWC